MSSAISRRYLFGAVTYKRLGDVSRLDLFGTPVYMRVGSARRLLGISWLGK